MLNGCSTNTTKGSENMRAYSARHITRLASYSGPVTNGDNLMELIDFDPDFTNPKIFKIQIADNNYLFFIQFSSKCKNFVIACF